MKKPLVSVLVLNWNGMEHLEECFSSLVEGCQREDVEFVLLDNASTDESVAFVRERFSDDPRIVVECLDKNYGWSGGNNRGIVRAIERGAKYIFLLNNDTKVERGCIENLIDMSEAYPDVGGLAPKMLLYGQPWLLNSVGLECSIIGSAWDRGLGRVDTPRWNEVSEVIGICGGAMWLRADVLAKVGSLPEEFFIYLDDLDLCLRIWNAGYRILTCPNAVVYHKFSATWEGSPEKVKQKYFLNTRNRFYLMERNFPASKFLNVLFWTKWGEMKAIGNALRKREYWRIQKHIQSWIDAFRYFPRAMRWRRKFVAKVSEKKEPPFWKLLKKKPLFCPEVEIPVKGWYKPVYHKGENFLPMSKCAEIEHKGGNISFVCGNIFPDYGEIDIDLKCNGKLICNLKTVKLEKYSFDLPAGTVRFEAKRIFEAECIKSPYDVGGWFRFENLNMK